ncbi:MAG: hypothetical protein IPF63_03960 [Bacteroidetes bacterium]|nr:hypothetical protein [Bacteroidota bacterium]
MLIDSVYATKNDIDFIAKLGAWNVPFAWVFKADKLNQLEVQRISTHFTKTSKELGAALPPVFVTSLKETFWKKRNVWAFMNHFDQKGSQLVFSFVKWAIQLPTLLAIISFPNNQLVPPEKSNGAASPA